MPLPLPLPLPSFSPHCLFLVSVFPDRKNSFIAFIDIPDATKLCIAWYSSSCSVSSSDLLLFSLEVSFLSSFPISLSFSLVVCGVGFVVCIVGFVIFGWAPVNVLWGSCTVTIVLFESLSGLVLIPLDDFGVGWWDFAPKEVLYLSCSGTIVLLPSTPGLIPSIMSAHLP